MNELSNCDTDLTAEDAGAEVGKALSNPDGFCCETNILSNPDDAAGAGVGLLVDMLLNTEKSPTVGATDAAGGLGVLEERIDEEL